MQKTKFYKLGLLLYSGRWYIIGLWIIILLSCLPFLPHIITPFKTTGFIAENSESAKAEEEMNKSLGYNKFNKIIIMYTSKTLLAGHSRFTNRINESLSGLKQLPIAHQIILPKDNDKQISKDKHTAYVVVIIKSMEPLQDERLQQFKSLIKVPSGMNIQFGGEPIFIEDVNKQTQNDLYKADFIATPVALITLLLIFGSVTAALLPLVLGGGCALMILSTLFGVGHLCTLSIFTLNIALLLGLCLSLDYALFMISRFRDELKNEGSIQNAIAITQATAGKAIFFSGLAVFISLSALFFFPINILFSVAMGGMIAVSVAVLTALVFLPAILSVLHIKINFLPIKLCGRFKHIKFWHWIADKVVKRPLVFFFPIFIFLLALGHPFLSAKFGVSDYKILPEHSEKRKFFDTYDQKFNILNLTPILLLIKTQPQHVLNSASISKLYHLAKKIKSMPLVKEVNSIVTSSPKLTASQYFHLYNPKDKQSTSIKNLLATTTSSYLTVFSIISKYPAHSSQTKDLITELGRLKAPQGMHLSLTGGPVNNNDVIKTIMQRLPYAIAWIMVFTYIILLILLRSIFLPLKAIIMNLLSLCACYGALVLVFQEGYLSNWLNFQPQGMLDVSLLVIIFCALFGFSMDYEVFLLSRIKEFYDATKNNNKSIIFGIEKTSKIITSAALIVICTCGSFFVADVLMVKAFGLGIAVAIFVDAFLIRTLLVPSTMALIKKWNWYLPRWLSKILPRG